MRHHLDGGKFRCHLGEGRIAGIAAGVLPSNAGEHQFLIGIFMIDAEQPCSLGLAAPGMGI